MGHQRQVSSPRGMPTKGQESFIVPRLFGPPSPHTSALLRARASVNTNTLDLEPGYLIPLSATLRQFPISPAPSLLYV